MCFYVQNRVQYRAIRFEQGGSLERSKTESENITYIITLERIDTA